MGVCTLCWHISYHETPKCLELPRPYCNQQCLLWGSQAAWSIFLLCRMVPHRSSTLSFPPCTHSYTNQMSVWLTDCGRDVLPSFAVPALLSLFPCCEGSQWYQLWRDLGISREDEGSGLLLRVRTGLADMSLRHLESTAPTPVNIPTVMWLETSDLTYPARLLS